MTDARLRELRAKAIDLHLQQHKGDRDQAALALAYAVPELLDEIERLRSGLPTEAPDIGEWTATFEPFEDVEGYEYEPDCAFALFHDGRPVAHVQTGSGSYDRAHVFGPGVELVYSAELDAEDDPEWTGDDPLLTVARRWCEARLAEMTEDRHDTHP